MPRADNTVHSSAWLFKPNSGKNGDGLGYREIDIFEHNSGISHASSPSKVSVGYHYGPDSSDITSDGEAISGIDLKKYHRFKVRWTPENIQIGAKNIENDRRLGGHVFTPRTRNGRFLPSRLQRPMRLRIDVNPHNKNMRGITRNILIKSITIYECIERTNTGLQRYCQDQIR
ncbi:MAG: hypothetical protein GDA48_12010 [Hormoscilla sp. GM102CHS1]|nr:hypothetical protein [Hormoscilla sp. GM102CHS1]